MNSIRIQPPNKDKRQNTIHEQLKLLFMNSTQHYFPELLFAFGGKGFHP